MVMVRVAAGLVEVTMPKSSSFGEMAMGLAMAVVEKRGAVWGVALSAWAVRVPGLAEVLVRARLHSAPGGWVVGQLWARVKLVEASVERARLGAAVVGLSLAR
jgi:hypothetical protein